MTRSFPPREWRIVLPREWDVVRVSGYCQNLKRFVYNLRGTVGYAHITDRNFKVWPHSTVPGDTDGKLWFDRHFTRTTLVRPREI